MLISRPFSSLTESTILQLLRRHQTERQLLDYLTKRKFILVFESSLRLNENSFVPSRQNVGACGETETDLMWALKGTALL